MPLSIVYIVPYWYFIKNNYRFITSADHPGLTYKELFAVCLFKVIGRYCTWNQDGFRIISY